MLRAWILADRRKPFTPKFMGAENMPLEKELEVYRAKLSDWKEHEGKFVLIHGENVEGFYGTYEEAIRQGYTKFGLSSPFLVKQIHSVEKAHLITRFAIPAKA